ncbi:oligosaccharide flippase family protein [Paraburkholderia hospita]|uniref:PST family polysaccharide export protein n=1 Tax=Paraburkholderia hospita TaxID=169430 RepID=A0AAN1J8K2_9BURK|nr:oligosaccharide flippase family protein [Paraburkholderia hospita]AUT69411.1 PST family polysaccharide export protein [Paraburkholderia hospita]SEI19260.1 polysaccharide transporter, PST family [Paraburkholderia hospita]
MRTMRLPAFSFRAGLGSSAATWVLLQQVLMRGLVAVKFLAIGRILGPEAIGSVSVALLAVAIAEAMSDTGLSQAVIQGQAAPTRDELGSVWTTLATRGLIIGVALVAIAPLMNSQFHLGGALLLLQLAALLPLLRGIASPAYYVVQRERRFQHVAVIEVSAAFVDCCCGLALALAGAGAYSVLLGMIVGESLKTTLTWITMTPRPPIRLRWSGIGHYIGFSRWIWAGSVVNLILNQFDKVVVGKLLGPTQLGAYQMSSRLAQMLLADAAIAMSQYLFPTFAARHRADPHAAARLFRRYIGVIALGLVAVVLVLRLAAHWLFALILGPAWLPAVPLFRIFVINMAIGALIAVLVSYLRAVGDAKATTQASVIQVFVLVACVPPATHYWGVTGIAWAMTVGLSSAAAWMTYRTARVM